MAASVSSLDQDMKKLRMSRYTTQAVNETREWIEEMLRERLPGGDLLEALKDGTALCRLINLALPPPGIKFKKSSMPFIQMENISHFLRACEQPPLNLPSHDRFLTVDLYESKDPAQVIQCLGAFSRAANALNPYNIPTTIGPRRGGSAMSPTDVPSSSFMTPPLPNRARGNGSTKAHSGSSTFNPLSRPERALSPALTGGSNSSRTTDTPRSPPGPVSSWSTKSSESSTAPAWNIHQYGYMGGASQGNQGIAFGARRQITSAGPNVPSLAEKERKKREKEAEEERLRVLAEEAENERRIERQAEEERARIEEEQRWEEEARRAREEEKQRVDQQKRDWEDQERRWKEDEESRKRAEREENQRLEYEKETQKQKAASSARLRGQYLSEHQTEQGISRSRRSSFQDDPELAAEKERVRELEQQLLEAKERERRYLAEREERLDRKAEQRKARSRSRSRPAPRPPSPRAPSPKDSEVSWVGDEREYLRGQWNSQRQHQAPVASRPLPIPAEHAPALSSRPLPDPTPKQTMEAPPQSPRPLPNPRSYNVPTSVAASPPPPVEKDDYLTHKPVPPQPPSKPTPLFSSRSPFARPSPSQQTPPAGDDRGDTTPTSATSSKSPFVPPKKPRGFTAATRSLLEREMELERERQKEWEKSQQEMKNVTRDQNEGVGPGQTWDVNQYGFTGGDNQNRVGSGIGFGGRRQIIGPRSLGGPRPPP